MDLSIVIPAYNEAHRIGQTLAAIEHFAGARSLRLEVLLVDDGGTDDTARIVEEFIEAGTRSASYRLLKQPRNMGKGAAIRRGVAEATCKLIGFTDADLPFGIEALERGSDLLEREPCVQMVVGARNTATSEEVERPPFGRRVAGRVYSVLARSIVHTGISDTQCGLKLFRSAVAKNIFSRTTVNGFGFDVEVIHIARVNRLQIELLPVHLHRHEGSRVNLLRDSTKMFMELFKIRIQNLRRFYSFELERDQIAGDYQHSALTKGPAVQRAWHANRLDILEQVVPELEFNRALDAGCGSGIALGRIAQLGHLVVGVDACLPPLRFARSSNPTSPRHVTQGTTVRLPFARASFDLVLFQEVIEHLPTDDVRATLSEFHRTLAPGGRLWITTPNYRGPWPLIEYVVDALHLTPRMGGDQHLTKFTRKRLEAALRSSGFRIEKMGGFNFFSPWLAAISKRLSQRIARFEAQHEGSPALLLYALAVREE